MAIRKSPLPSKSAKLTVLGGTPVPLSLFQWCQRSAHFLDRVFLIVQREPEGVGRATFNAVAATRRNDEVITRVEFQGFTGLEAERGLAAKQQHPFGPLLIIPESVGTRRTAGNDVFQCEARMPHQCRDGFPAGKRGR